MYEYHLEKTLKRCFHDFRGFAKDEEVAKIIKAVVEMANIFDLGVEEDVTEELLEVTPEELTIQKLLKLEQECTAEEEAKENCGKRKRRIPKKIKSKGYGRFCRSQQGP